MSTRGVVMWPSGKAPAGLRVQSPVGRRFFAAIVALILTVGRPAITWCAFEDLTEVRQLPHKTFWLLADKLKGREGTKRPTKSFLNIGAHSNEPEVNPSTVKDYLESDISDGSKRKATDSLINRQVQLDWLENSSDFDYSKSRTRLRLHTLPSRPLATPKLVIHNVTTLPIVAKPAETPTKSSRSSKSHRTRRRHNHRRLSRRSVMRHQPPLSCFSCASAEYEPLYSRSDNLFSFGQPLQFDQSCDSRTDLHTFAPAIRCDATCITVLEPQYFGGILNEQRPYLYVRGCATDIFAVANAAVAAAATSRDAISYRDNGEFLEPVNSADGPRLPSPDMERLYRSEMCVVMSIQDLWPELYPPVRSGVSSLSASAGEMAKVCACKTSGCNTHDAADSGAGSASQPATAFFPTFLLLISFILH